MDLDSIYMRMAFEEAQTAEEQGEVPVGAVIVDPVHNKVIARAYNLSVSSSDPTAHAEICAIRKAAREIGNHRLNGLDIYVTLEPCTMCTGAISHARLSRLIYGAKDTKGGAVCSGIQFFSQSTCHWKPQIISGVMADDCASLLRNFFIKKR